MQRLRRVFALCTLIYTELVLPPEITMTTQGVIVCCLLQHFQLTQGRKSADMWRSVVQHVGSIGNMATASTNQMLILITHLKQRSLFDKEDGDRPTSFEPPLRVRKDQQPFNLLFYRYVSEVTAAVSEKVITRGREK